MRYAQLLEGVGGPCSWVASTASVQQLLLQPKSFWRRGVRMRVTRPLLLAYQKVAYGIATAKWPLTCTLPAAEVVHVISSLSHTHMRAVA